MTQKEAKNKLAHLLIELTNLEESYLTGDCIENFESARKLLEDIFLFNDI